MIVFLTGKPGAGKTLTAVRKAVDMLLAREDLTLVTNCALAVDKISVDVGQNLFPRIRELSDDEVSRFWLYRRDLKGEDYELIEVLGPEGYLRADYAEIRDHGTLYLIDEVHIIFHARQWAKAGMSMQHYATQHRKLGDEVLFTTQRLEQTEKQLRNLGQEYWSIQNLAYRGFGRFIRHAKAIKIHKFLTASANDRFPEVEQYPLDNRAIGWYDTTAGIGVRGNGQPEKTPHKRGIPVKVAIPLGVLLVIAVMIGLLKASEKGVEVALVGPVKRAGNVVTGSPHVIGVSGGEKKDVNLSGGPVVADGVGTWELLPGMVLPARSLSPGELLAVERWLAQRETLAKKAKKILDLGGESGEYAATDPAMKSAE